MPPASENPRLRFWHWFSFNCGDYGVVQIKVGGGSWTNISTSYSNYGSGVWTCPSIDLTAYADSSVQLAFFFHSEDCWPPGWDTDVGWYIDDVKIVTGPLIFNNPEGFENGLGDWAAERGTWQVGTPTSAPDSAYQGQGCAATVLAGNYYEWVDSRLVSPAFVVPPASDNPRLRFWHWFSFNCGDYGVVQIKVGDGSWTNISTSYSNYGSGVWTCPSIDLTAYADSTVQLAFFFHSEDCWPPGWDTDVGWYIDEVKFVTGPLTFLDDRDPNGSRFVGFENGLGDWAAERGTWEVGTPTSGPNSCYQGQGCAATVLAGNYYEWVDSRLFSPVLLVEERGGEPALRFWHWYSFNCGDYGEIHIRVDEGPWQVLEGSARFVGPSGAWTPYRVPLVPYRGHVFQLAFFLHSEDCWPPGWDTGAGWYIDEIKLDWVKPVAVQLADFQGRALGDGVELVWELNGEDPIAGIDVYRAEDADSAERVLIEALPEGARRYVDASVTAGRTYRYLLGIRLADGTVTWSRELTVTAGAPAHLAVRHFPNPFNPTVTIEFELPVQARIALTVHDVAGRRVRTLTNGLRPAGRHRVTWDGKDDAGHLGGSGVYFYRLDAGGSILLGRMTLLR